MWPPCDNDRQVFKKKKKSSEKKQRKKSPTDHLGSVSGSILRHQIQLHRNQMSIFPKLFPSCIPLPFSFVLFHPLSSSLFPWTSVSLFLPFVLTSPTISQAIICSSPKRLQWWKRKGFKESHRLGRRAPEAGEVPLGQSLRTGHPLLGGSSPNRRLGFSGLDSCTKPGDFKAFRGWQGLANFKLSNQLQPQRTQDNHQWAEWNCWSWAALSGFTLVGPPHCVQLRLCLSE